ncbi:uncharacterized protein LOC112501741 isoform X2 [Cynara cardunculus var. scolymus]|uniref:uncharacterized protein LOC112501741 isoform X2 n=1 Tax=Cynara cardunculus var. scolymus TaxID=59895 RepID=UPI000D62453A|nr:uncharacterized protein LOC112501741 isoform X2 [Cynara cardunculus var. scolymus]
MAKYGELWDDSALVKAFDDAISKYKIMHGKGGDEDLLKEEKITKGTEENAPIIMNGSNEVKSANVETDNKTTDMTKNITHTREATDSSVAEKCSSEVIDKCTPPSIVVQVDAESAEAYKRLLDQYNAVEEQRQKLLEQFSQYGNWDYQEGKKGQEVETGSTNVAQDRTSQTDLSVVLNAWFSAGFHTGKYLSEQRKPAVSTSSPLTTREEIERVPSKENSTDSSFKEIPKGK